MQKILIIAVAFLANLSVTWIANKGGRIPDTGSFFGWHYDSRIIASTIFTLKFLWFWIILNAAFVYASKSGIEAFSSYMVFILIWIAMAPISVFVFNFFVNKEPVSPLQLAGVAFVFCGTILIYANREITAWLK